MFFLRDISESEGNWGDAHVLSLLELILEGGKELRVDLLSELFHIFNTILKFLLLVKSPLFKLIIPSIIDLLDSTGAKNETSSSNLWLGVFQEEGIQQADFAEILSEEEDLVILSCRRELTETFQEAKSWRNKEVELEGGEYLELHLQDLFLCELVLRDVQQLLKIRRVNFLVFGRD